MSILARYLNTSQHGEVNRTIRSYNIGRHRRISTAKATLHPHTVGHHGEVELRSKLGVLTADDDGDAVIGGDAECGGTLRQVNHRHAILIDLGQVLHVEHLAGATTGGQKEAAHQG